jgi:hypothetical protein
MIDVSASIDLFAHYVALGFLAFGLCSFAGCGSDGTGQITVSPEARARIVPHVSPTAKNAKETSVTNEAISPKILVRQKAPSGS